MAKYCTFNNKKNTDFPRLLMRSKTRPTLPIRNDRYLPIPGRDGAYRFSGDTEDRHLEINFTLIASTFEDLWATFRDVAAWFYTKDKQQLIFEDESDKYYMAVVDGEIVPILRQGMIIADFTVKFRCDPFAYSLDTAGSITLDSDIILNSDIRLDDVFDFAVTAPVTLEVNNFGTAEVASIITVTGTFTTLSLTVNGKTFNYNIEPLTAGTLSINNEKWDVTLDGANKNAKWDGDRVVLAPGINQVQIGGTDLNCTVSFGPLRPKFL